MRRYNVILPVILTLCCSAAGSGRLLAQDVPPPPPPPIPTSAPFPPGNIRPTLLDFITGQPVSYRMQVASTPKLLRPPFCNQPLNQPKGLASAIKAQQLDVKNRVKAVRFLGQQDCMDPGTAEEGKPPQPGKTQKVLMATMESDPSEVVRYEAVLALENQLSRGPCAKAKRNSRGRFENCLGCCNEEVLKRLSARAYDMDPHNCPVEPSARVRQAAIHALSICCDPNTSTVPVTDAGVNPNGNPNGGQNGVNLESVPAPVPVDEGQPIPVPVPETKP